MSETQHFRISPIIRITLTLFYLALLLPLPFLAQHTGGASPLWLTFGLLLGLIALQGALAQQVIVNQQGIQVTYPRWVPSWWTTSWSLSWTEIQSLKIRTTGQGGLVYYFLTHPTTEPADTSTQQAYLLPMRVAGFGYLTTIIADQTGLDLKDVRPLAQPWMYFMLAGLTLLLLALDAWVISVALTSEAISLNL